jgi:hypothetical protein
MSLISGRSSTIEARNASVMGRRWIGGVPRMLAPVSWRSETLLSFAIQN